MPWTYWISNLLIGSSNQVLHHPGLGTVEHFSELKLEIKNCLKFKQRSKNWAKLPAIQMAEQFLFKIVCNFMLWDAISFKLCKQVLKCGLGIITQWRHANLSLTPNMSHTCMHNVTKLFASSLVWRHLCYPFELCYCKCRFSTDIIKQRSNV